MSANSFLIDTAQSMIVVDPNEFPLGLGKTTREDYPIQSSDVMLYYGKNILPTPFGYKSFFDQSTLFEVNALTGKLVQRIIAYQTSTMLQILIALCEDGIYIVNATGEGADPNWVKVVDTSAGEEFMVRRLWTVAVVSNKVIFYLAGESKFWALVDPARYAEAATPSPIAGATRAQVWTNWGCGMLSYIPSFLNMAGQIGLFRADNRLGFWDSDGAVAWSSATYIEDFKPSAQTFAGVTKFSDVLGNIVKVIGQADGFVIYSTKSIVRATNLVGSPEKWRGEAITSELGVAFDTQIAASQPDDTHFCITGAGLLMIREGESQYVAPEVMDFIVKNNLLISLSMIEGRYLFIHTDSTFPTSVYEIKAETITDASGNAYVVQPPTYPTPTTEDYFNSLIQGNNGGVYEGIKDFEPIPGAELPLREPLIPCYDSKHFESVWAEATFTPDYVNTKYVDSVIASGYRFPISNAQVRAPIDNYYDLSSRAIDIYGDGVWEEYNLAFQAITRNMDYQLALVNAITSRVIDITGLEIALPEGHPAAIGTVIDRDNEEVYTDKITNLLLTDQTQIQANECSTRIFAPTGDLNVRYKFTGTEEVIGSILYAFIGGSTSSFNFNYDGDGTSPAEVGSYTYNRAKQWIAYTLTPQDILDYDEFINAADPFPCPPVNSGLNPTSADAIAMGIWICKFKPSRILAGNVSAAGFLTNLSTTRSGTIYSNLYPCVDPVSGQTLPSWSVPGVSGSGLEWLWGPGITFLGSRPNPPNTYHGYLADAVYPDYYNRTELAAYGIEHPPEDTVDCQSMSGTFNNYSATDLWTVEQRNAIYATHGSPSFSGAKKLRLTGSIVAEYDLTLAEYPQDVDILKMELTGWGYIPKGFTNFRKTHRRVFSTSCPIPTSGSYLNMPDPDNLDDFRIPSSDSNSELGVKPPYQWDYPTSVPFPPGYALYQTGSLAAYYPTYTGAIVYDSLQQKWGMYNNNHQLVYELNPVNRADNTVMPVADNGMFAGALTDDNRCAIFKDNNPEAVATYGKIGYYRLGMTAAYEIRAYFRTPAYGHLIVEASIDGQLIDPALSQAITLDGQNRAIIPFTSVAKWFNIRIEGQFHLHTLQFNGESKSRR